MDTIILYCIFGDSNDLFYSADKNGEHLILQVFLMAFVRFFRTVILWNYT